jgi:hypothetical protein
MHGQCLTSYDECLTYLARARYAVRLVCAEAPLATDRTLAERPVLLRHLLAWYRRVDAVTSPDQGQRLRPPLRDAA